MSDVHLYSFQQEGLDRTEERNRVAYFWEMGTGKTFVGSEKLAELSRHLNLLICQKSKIDDWIRHFKEHYPIIRVYNLTNSKEFGVFIKDSSYDGVMKLGVINYELAWRRATLLKLSGFTLMLDESSLIQNSKAKQTRFILKLDPANVILLSGTPCSGKYENLWTQVHLLGWPISEELFLSQYVNYKLIKVGKAYHKTVDKANPYKNVERLKAKLREYGADFLKTDECFGLPEQTFTDVKVPVSNEYKHYMKHSIVTVDGVELVGNTTLTKRLYARMLCAQHSKAKLEAFWDLLESTNGRLVVFYSFNEELAQLSMICGLLHKPISKVNGWEKNLKAYEEHEDSVTLVQYQAGAKGLNLQLANKIIFFSPTERCEDYMQALKRIHRIGQHKPCFYYRMMCAGSVEESIYQALERGEDYTNDLFNKEFK